MGLCWLCHRNVGIVDPICGHPVSGIGQRYDKSVVHIGESDLLLLGKNPIAVDA
jgi:hypothetical protein